MYKVVGNIGDMICVVTDETERNVIGTPDGKIIITDYYSCKNLADDLNSGKTQLKNCEYSVFASK